MASAVGAAAGRWWRRWLAEGLSAAAACALGGRLVRCFILPTITIFQLTLPMAPSPKNATRAIVRVSAGVGLRDWLNAA